MQLPAAIEELLHQESIGILSTSYRDQPHAFLMIFTYLPDQKTIILSSRRDTSKLQHIQQNSRIALLIYSLGHQGNPPLSCTLYGRAHVIPSTEDLAYRERHYEKHQSRGNFIWGENIAVISMEITHAEMSDAEDNVSLWPAEGTMDEAT